MRPTDEQLLAAARDGNHSGAEVCAEMERHLASCGKCRARCDSLRASLRLCRAAGQEEVPPAIAYSVRAAVRRVLDSTS